ncbi:MAG: hypothetical protein AAFO81_00890 [Pseudomonadota bacterium]
MTSIRAIVVFVLVWALAGCSTFEVEGAGSIRPDAITGSQTVHGSLYGIQWAPLVTEKCGNDHLFRVEYHTNALLLLTAVATLGVYVPQTVEWWCVAAPDDSDEAVWDPASEMPPL